MQRNQWSLARIEEVLPSGDGLARKARLRLANGKLDDNGKPKAASSVLDRPIYKLMLLVLSLASDNDAASITEEGD